MRARSRRAIHCYVSAEFIPLLVYITLHLTIDERDRGTPLGLEPTSIIRQSCGSRDNLISYTHHVILIEVDYVVVEVNDEYLLYLRFVG